MGQSGTDLESQLTGFSCRAEPGIDCLRQARCLPGEGRGGGGEQDQPCRQKERMEGAGGGGEREDMAASEARGGCFHPCEWIENASDLYQPPVQWAIPQAAEATSSGGGVKDTPGVDCTILSPASSTCLSGH
ncbi:hypothetical protein INR49_016225 [Caranx melampygus]|nr:hypothetical protein INR49_016225 [Caranx melampygus]